MLIHQKHFIHLAMVSLLVLCVQANRENLQQLRNIELSLDRGIDPCDNFYGYACGNWAELHANDNDSSTVAVVENNLLSDVEHKIIAHYPDKTQFNKRGQTFTEKALTFYHSCIAAHSADLWRYFNEFKPAAGVEWPLVEEINAQRRNRGDFVVRQWQYAHLDAFSLMGEFLSYGVPNQVVRVEVVKEAHGLTVTLGNPDEHNFDESAARRILSNTGLPAEIQDRYLEEIMETSVYWQGQYNPDKDEDRSTNYETFKAWFPQLVPMVDGAAAQQMQKDDKVNITNYAYYSFLAKRTWSPVEIQQLANYLMVNFLGHKLRRQQSDERNCISILQNRMPSAFKFLYHKHIFRPEAQAIIDDLSTLIRQLYKNLADMVDENHMNLRPAERDVVKGRLQDMIINIGNLPEKFNQSMVADIYHDLPDLDIENFHRNDLLLLKHRTVEYLKHSTDTVETSNDVKMFPINMVEKNLLLIPFAALRPPFYHHRFDPLLSLSMFGFVLGHELAHTVHMEALSTNVYLSDIWYRSEVKAATDCLLEQNPQDRLQVESIADLVGLRLAYRTYSREYNTQPQFTRIPWQRLFFLNLGNFFCSRHHNDDDARRLHQLVTNLESFGEAFHCPAKSKMNPAKKCRAY